MPRKNIPDSVRALFQMEEEVEPVVPEDKPEIVNRPTEAKRVVKRISKIIDEHRDASAPLGVKFDSEELSIVIAGLRNHARGGSGALELGDCDEIESHCLNRLFEELVEEPSNILYVTKTGADTTRYDAMDSSFWIECLDLLEKTQSNKKD